MKAHSSALTNPPETEHLPCPRCSSTNTKFCYYNNYNLSQPRHFCKSCRRYWTQGGTLRNIPVGGGTRHKTHKRSRSSTPVSGSPIPVEPGHISLGFDPNPTMMCLEPNADSFISFLDNSSSEFGLGQVYDEIAPSLSRVGSWPYHEVGSSGGCNGWQYGGEGGFVEGECFPWTDLAISMSTKGGV